MAYQFREPWMELGEGQRPIAAAAILRTRMMSDEPRHPTKELVLPDTGKVVHIDESCFREFGGLTRLDSRHSSAAKGAVLATTSPTSSSKRARTSRRSCCKLGEAQASMPTRLGFSKPGKPKIDEDSFHG